MKKISYIDILFLLVWLAPIVYLKSVFNNLPQTVPVHFNINGVADRFGNKSEVATTVFVMSGISLGIYLLMIFLPKIDPKQVEKTPSLLFKKIGFAVLLLFSFISFMVIQSAFAGKLSGDKYLFPALGLFFAYLGNLMFNIKPNYFAGIRTPWTLNNEENWKATHRLSSKLWVIGGLLIAALCLFLGPKASLAVFITGIIILTAIPITYSYLHFKKSLKK